MGAPSSDLDDLIDACQRRPTSSILLRTLLSAAATPEERSRIASFVTSLSPRSIEDAALRESVATLLDQTTSAEIAARWRKDAIWEQPGSEPTIVDFATRKPLERSGTGDLRLGDVAGLEDVKRQLRRGLISPAEHQSLFARFKRRPGGGLLLYGAPGCGKTMIVRAVAAEANAHLIAVEAAEILDNRVGFSEKRLVAAFAEARARKPAVLFFDEVEALAARRETGSEFKASLVSAFLGAFDSLQQANHGVMVLGATNAPWSVDGAFRRPGRFDRMLFVPPPDRAARAIILRNLLATRPVAEDVDVEWLAAATPGFSGADLLSLVETAIDLAIEAELAGIATPQIARKHLANAKSEVRPTTAEWLTTARNFAKYANSGGCYDGILAFLDRHAQ